MYYPYFITYIIIGFVLTLMVFLWALNNGQFKDQQRARYLPLADEWDKPEGKVTRFNRYEGYALILLACAGLLASLAVLVFALWRG